MPLKLKPIVLIVLDGWGYSENTQGNAILAANTPTWDHLWRTYPHNLLCSSGTEVGLPARQMGNSEVGHLNLGAGRVIYQEFTRINHSIQTGSFFTNQAFTKALDIAIDNNKAVHILGLLSPGGVHSHEQQIYAMLELAAKQGAKQIYMHAFLDGRDTPPKSAGGSLKAMQAKFQELGIGRTASIIGRFYAMDRDQRWPRIQTAYDLIAHGKAAYQAEDPMSALELAYERGETDEFVQATTIVPPGEQPMQVEDGDVIIFMNYRSDRARQITRTFTETNFNHFERDHMPKLGRFVSLTEYSAKFDIPVAYPPEPLANVLGEYISKLGLHQLRIAETEKYAHVTFFFNGGREEPFEFEDRILIPSPDHIKTYDEQPEMSAPQLTDKLVNAIESNKYDVIICNYANSDMVAHTGNYDATVKAIEVLDTCLEKVVDAVQRAGGEMLITADHGNAEQMLNEKTEQPHTAHTSNPVPLLYIGRAAKIVDGGTLSDIAPTMLYLMELERPQEMNGASLVILDDQATSRVTC